MHGQQNIKISSQSLKKYANIKFHEIRSVRNKFLHADGQT